METSMEIKIKATSPCAKFYNASLRDQVQKIKEEVLEVEEALEKFLTLKATADVKTKDDAAIQLFVEMYDVVACVNTMNSQLKYRFPSYFNEKNSIAAELSVVNKNMVRGYYAPEV